MCQVQRGMDLPKGLHYRLIHLLVRKSRIFLQCRPGKHNSQKNFRTNKLLKKAGNYYQRIILQILV